MPTTADNYKFILNPMGSAGDVHPYLGVAIELMQRGHEVLLLTNGSFASTAQRFNVPFRPVGEVVDWKDVAKDEKLRKQGSAWKVAMGWASHEPMRQTYQLIAQNNQVGRTCVVSPVWSFAAKLANEKLGIPHVNFIVNSMVLRSLTNTPQTPQMYFPRWMPRWLKWYQYFWADVLFIDPVLARPLNTFRRELGLRRVFRVMNRWWFSKQKSLGLFFPFMTPVQRDWPVPVTLVGHPMWDPPGDLEMTQRAIEFCRSGSPPILFVPGSVGPGGASFFAAAMEACERLDQRAIFLDRNEHYVPHPLPTNIAHYEYVPLKAIASLCSAIVHSGCAGTLHHGLAAGLGHVVWPRVNDQPDNARRLCEIGVAVELKNPDANALTNAIQQVLTNEDIKGKRLQYAASIQGYNAVDRICDELESFMLSQNAGVR